MDKNDNMSNSAALESSMIVKKLPATPSGAVESQRCGCPVIVFQPMISGEYKIRILCDLKDRPRRYDEIGAGLLSDAAGTKEIAPRVLSLKALAAAGLTARKDCGLAPPKVRILPDRGG
jgi:DNA-binding HxlR family transcriptional regulator